MAFWRSSDMYLMPFWLIEKFAQSINSNNEVTSKRLNCCLFFWYRIIRIHLTKVIDLTPFWCSSGMHKGPNHDLEGALMEHFFEGITPLRQLVHWPITNILFWVNLPISLNGALPSRKCSFKAPAKCKIFINVLLEICLQWIKRLGP